MIFRKYGSSDIETAANTNIFEEILTSSAEIMLSCRVLYVMEQDERLDFGTPFLLKSNSSLIIFSTFSVAGPFTRSPNL